jgi:hypothetical protein
MESGSIQADRAALNALRKIPGFDMVLRKVFGMFGERALLLAFKANAVKVTENQYPDSARCSTRRRFPSCSCPRSRS